MGQEGCTDCDWQSSLSPHWWLVGLSCTDYRQFWLAWSYNRLPCLTTERECEELWDRGVSQAVIGRAAYLLTGGRLGPTELSCTDYRQFWFAWSYNRLPCLTTERECEELWDRGVSQAVIGRAAYLLTGGRLGPTELSCTDYRQFWLAWSNNRLPCLTTQRECEELWGRRVSQAVIGRAAYLLTGGRWDPTELSCTDYRQFWLAWSYNRHTSWSQQRTGV